MLKFKTVITYKVLHKDLDFKRSCGLSIRIEHSGSQIMTAIFLWSNSCKFLKSLVK